VTDVFSSIAFYVFGLVSVGGAIGMIGARRLVHSAIFLVVSFLGVAAIYLLAGADFLSGVQVLVYAGAIMILMLFAIMLTPGQVEAATGAGQKLAAALVAGAFLVVTAFTLMGTNWPMAQTVSDKPTTDAIGQLVLNRYVLPFELASVLLLAALVGAILIARED
jgi:NADH-quinone oxidoreductase subunit J